MTAQITYGHVLPRILNQSQHFSQLENIRTPLLLDSAQTTSESETFIQYYFEGKED